MIDATNVVLNLFLVWSSIILTPSSCLCVCPVFVATYVTGDDGGTCGDTSTYYDITTLDECLYATNPDTCCGTMTTHDTDDRPAGCFYYNGSPEFNENSDATYTNKFSDIEPVCINGITPTPPPSPAPTVTAIPTGPTCCTETFGPGELVHRVLQISRLTYFVCDLPSS